MLKKNTFAFFLDTGFPIFLVSVLFFLIGNGFFSNIYISHDDWDYMLSHRHTQPGFITPFISTSFDGRWMNYLWSLLAKHMDYRSVYTSFIAIYSLFCWVAAYFLCKNSLHRLVIALLIFFCPAYASLSSWPATLTISCLLSFFTLIILNNINVKISYKLFFVINILLIMSYPPLSLAMIVYSCAILAHKPNFNPVKFVSISFISYALSILLIFSLNYIFHHHFGIHIAGWRHPHHIHSLHDVMTNFFIAMKSCLSSFEYHWPIMAFSLFVLFVSVSRKEKMGIAILCAFVYCLLMDFNLVFTTGVDIPPRANIWQWAFLCSALALYFGWSEQGRIPLKKYNPTLVSACIAAGMLFVGCREWLAFHSENRDVAIYQARISENLLLRGQKTVIVCGDPSRLEALRSTGHDDPLAELRVALKKIADISVLAGTKDECAPADRLPDGPFYRKGQQEYLMYDE